MKKSKKKIQITIKCFLMIVSMWFVFHFTLLTREQSLERKHIFRPFYSYYCLLFRGEKGWLTQNLLNILLFLPMGFSVSFILKNNKYSYKKVIGLSCILGFSTSMFVEVTQYILKLGFFETDDLINNAVGAAVGSLIYMLISCFVARRMRIINGRRNG